MAMRFWLAIIGIVAIGGGAGYFAAPIVDYMSASDDQAVALAERAPQETLSGDTQEESVEASAERALPTTSPRDGAEQSSDIATGGAASGIETAALPAESAVVDNRTRSLRRESDGATDASTAAAGRADVSAAPSLGAVSDGLTAPDASPSESRVAPPPAPNAAATTQTAALAAAGTALRDSGVANLRGEAPSADTNDGLRPTFDVVRVEPNGSAVLAGRATPGAKVSVRVDGEVKTEVQADRRGEFVALLDAPEDDAPGLTIDLTSVARDGAVASSASPVVIVLPKTPGRTALAVRPSPRGAELLQPTAPRIDGGLSIDAVTYDAQGDVVITGRGTPGEVARIYLDDGLRTETRVGADGGWRAALGAEVAPQVYNLRVDQIAGSGAVSSRAETPFERAPVEEIVLREGGVIVQPGNNLWKIASHVYGDGFKYLVIFEENRTQIRDPDLIYPGQVFDLPNSVEAATVTTE